MEFVLAATHAQSAQCKLTFVQRFFWSNHVIQATIYRSFYDV